MRKWKLGVCPGDRVCLRLIDNSEAPAVFFFFNQLLTRFLTATSIAPMEWPTLDTCQRRRRPLVRPRKKNIFTKHPHCVSNSLTQLSVVDV